MTDDDGRAAPAGNAARPSGLARGTERSPALDAALADDDRFVRLTTRGRTTGLARTVTVGVVRERDGSILVAAGAPDSAWALNLLADPAVTVVLAGHEFAGRAESLEAGDPRLGRAVRELILRYGTPSEGLGSGPVFVIRPVDPPV